MKKGSKTNTPYVRKKEGKNGGYLPIDPLTLFDLYWNKKLTYREIAFALNVCHQTICNRMKEFGIPTMYEGNYTLDQKGKYKERHKIHDEKIKEKTIQNT